PRRLREGRATPRGATSPGGAGQASGRSNPQPAGAGRPGGRRACPEGRLGSRVNERLLLDNSAWSRLAHPSLPGSRTDEVADAVERGMAFASLPFLLEAGYSARN